MTTDTKHLLIGVSIFVVIIGIIGFFIFMREEPIVTSTPTKTQKETNIKTEPLPPKQKVSGLAGWVTKSPPELKTEVKPSLPDSKHVWTPGYWTYVYEKEDNWVWVPGKYAIPPRPGQVWIPGEWRENPNGASWSWTEGSWK